MCTGIRVLSYGAMGGLLGGMLWEHEVIQRAAKKWKRSPQELMLQWALNENVIPLSGSRNPQRVDQLLRLRPDNNDVFDFIRPEEWLKAYQPDAAVLARTMV